MLDLSPVSQLLADPGVTDILICSGKTLIERSSTLEQTSSVFDGEEELNVWVHTQFAAAGGRLDISQPIAEFSFESEFGLLRIHAVLGAECAEGTQISIRRHPIENFSLQDLQARGTISDSQLFLLRSILSARENFVIVGGTGAGKTTLLRAMLNEARQERIITLEENFELRLGGNSVALKTRGSNHEGVGEIDLNHLLKHALRMRPDRLVIGEARGPELEVLLQSLNTGHDGAGFTLHASSAREAKSRMLGILAGSRLDPKIALGLVLSSIHWIVEIRRTPLGREIVAVERFS